jgi:hypothetical protein
MNSIAIRIVDHSAATTALAICAVAVSPMGIAECRCQRMGITQRRPLIGLSLSRASVAEAKKSAVPEREIGGAGAHSFSPDLKSAVWVPRASSNLQRVRYALFSQFQEAPLPVRSVEVATNLGLDEETVEHDCVKE